MKRSPRIAALAVLTLLLLATSSAHATLYHYDVFFSGPNESPPNASPGNGVGSVDWDDVANTMALNASFSGLLGTTTASHIHAATAVAGTGTAGVATTTPSFAGFPLGVTAGSFSNTLDLTLTSSYNSSFITANGGTTASAEAALKNYIDSGRAYWNIHTSAFPGGEIRGFLIATPEPSTIVLAGLGMAAMCAYVRRTRRSHS